MLKNCNHPLQQGIVIRWQESYEYINIDLKNVRNLPKIITTIEWWEKEEKWVANTVICCFDKDKLIMELTYSKELNPLFPDYYVWGTSTIFFDKANKSGKAEWKSIDPNNVKYNGRVDWFSLE